MGDLLSKVETSIRRKPCTFMLDYKLLALSPMSWLRSCRWR